MASADFPPPLSGGISLGQCRPCPFVPSGSTCAVDDSWASLVLACSPAVARLTASSCSYGRRFASGPLGESLAVPTWPFGYGCRHHPVGDLSPQEVRHLPGTRVRPSSGAALVGGSSALGDSGHSSYSWPAAPEQINHRSGGWREVTLAIFLPKKRFSNVFTNAYTFASYKVVTWKDGHTPRRKE